MKSGRSLGKTKRGEKYKGGGRQERQKDPNKAKGQAYPSG
jgi:hypothetical protein